MILRPHFLVLLLAASSLVQAQTPARIARVTLFPGSATIERVAHVPAGASKFEISGLPANFDDRTLRLEADPGIRLGEFVVQDVARAEALNPRQAELEAKIQALDDQIAVLDVERQSAELVTGYLKGLGEPTSSGKPAAGEVRYLGTTLEAIRQGGNDALMRIQRVAVQKRALQAQQAALTRELAKLSEQNRDSRSLRVNLAAERAGALRISYQLNGPGWQPSYRASLDSASGALVLERQALIAQNSGEDWNEVALRLSTGQPRTAVQGQPPRPWLLSLREVRPLMAVPAESFKMAAGTAPAARRDRSDEPLFNVAEIQGMFATEFEVPTKVSLASDARKLTVQLGRQNLAARLRVQAVPRQEAAAYLVASADRPEGVWLPGVIQLYRDGAYIGATQWNAQAGEKLELPFGRDELVRISVNRTKAQSGSAGFIGNRGERELAEVYTVSNQHRQAIDLLLLEPSPVATHEDIKVEKSFEPKPTKENWDDKQGVAAWELNLPAGASQKFSLNYRITWPKASVVNGLP